MADLLIIIIIIILVVKIIILVVVFSFFFILRAHFCECNNLVLRGVAGDEVVEVGDDVHTDRAGQVIPDQQKLGQGDKGDNCIPAFGDKGKGGGEESKAAEEEESFHFLERPLR